MKTFFLSAIFIALCAVFTGVLTWAIYTISIEVDCDDTKAALKEYRAQHQLTLSELKRLERLIGRWGSTN
jgi:hypothetical protein